MNPHILIGPSVRIFIALWGLAAAQALYIILKEAYNIRLYAITEYGPIIHEFDPYFNFRATEYLYENGWSKFAKWFDYKAWYPLGRPVGTTIYPGMQVTAVFLKNYVIGDKMSLNNFCCYMPAWFGAVATFCTALLAYECSFSSPTFGSILSNIPIVSVVYKKVIVQLVNLLHKLAIRVFGTDFGLKNNDSIPKKRDMWSPDIECALGAAACMSIVPAHILRSVGGGFDNESVAVTAMTLTCYVWTRSLRGNGSEEKDNTSSWKWGILAGIAYFNMVAAWGGYVFGLSCSCALCSRTLFYKTIQSLHVVLYCWNVLSTSSTSGGLAMCTE